MSSQDLEDHLPSLKDIILTIKVELITYSTSYAKIIVLLDQIETSCIVIKKSTLRAHNNKP